MATNALAIVHIDPKTVRSALDSEGMLQGADGNAYRVRFFDDAVGVALGVSLGFGDPDVMGTLVATALGDLVDAHDDPRGVPLIPESYEPSSTTWLGLLDELGDAADWVPVQSEELVDAMPDMFGALGGQLPDLASLAQQLGGQDPAALMQQAMQIAQQLASSGALGPMQEMMQQMMQPPGAQPVMDAEFESSSDGDAAQVAQVLPAGMDLDAVTSQAQRFLDANPELMGQLMEQFGAVRGGSDDKDKK